MKEICPVCKRPIGKIPNGDEISFYCNRCRIPQTSFPKTNAYEKFCKYVIEHREEITKPPKQSPRRQDYVEGLLGNSVSEEFKFPTKQKTSRNIRDVVKRLKQDNEQIDKKFDGEKNEISEFPEWFRDFLYSNESFVSYIKKFPATDAEFDSEFKIELNEKIQSILKEKGISDLYKYQKLAFNSIIKEKKSTIVTAPTASGKTEAMIVPIMEQILSDQDHKGVFAVMVYPTKALASDQIEKIKKYTEPCGISIKRIDGDTSQNERRQIVEKPPKILVTNFDMVHIHAWKNKELADMLKNVKILGVDEIHKYDGVFGSNIHHVIARLKRISSISQIIGATATLDNAKDFCEKLFGEKINLIEGSGRQSNRYFVILESDKIREDIIDIFKKLHENNLKTIIFNNSRTEAEEVSIEGNSAGYNFQIHRAGLEPEYRKKIETELKNGNFDAISSTPTLELGIDIGALDAVITPFVSFNSLMQRIGRAGRSGQDAFAFMLLDGKDPVQNYYLENPKKIFEDNRFVTLDPNNEFLKTIHTIYKSKDRPLDKDEINDKVAEKLKNENVFDSPFSDSRDQKEGFIAHSKYDGLLEKFNIRDMGLNVKIIKKEKEEIEDWPIPMGYTKLHINAIYLSQGKVFEVVEEDILNDKNPKVKVDSRKDNEECLINLENLDTNNTCNEIPVDLSGSSLQPIGGKLNKVKDNVWGVVRTSAKIHKIPTIKKTLEKSIVETIPVKLCELDVYCQISQYAYYRKDGRPIYRDILPIADKRDTPVQKEVKYQRLDYTLRKPLEFKLKTTGIVIDLLLVAGKLREFDSITKKYLFGDGGGLWEESIHALEHLLVHSSHMIAGGIKNNLEGYVDYEENKIFIFDVSTTGGNGASKALFPKIKEIFERSKVIVENCQCDDGCPRCVEKLLCESYNQSLSKKGARMILSKLWK